MTALGKQIYGDDCSEEEAAAAWEIEIDKRIAEIDSGKMPMLDAFESLNQIRASLK